MTHYQGSVPAAKRAADWRDQAACRTEDPELFFPKGDSGPWLTVIEQAKAICHRCPVMEQCQQWAFAAKIDSGIFGGLTEQERRSTRRRAQRRKTPITAVTAAVKRAKPTTLRGHVDAYTTRSDGGHLAWTGPQQIHFRGQTFTPKQLCFLVDRGHMPDGRVSVECGARGCVLPVHIADTTERTRCGTRAGYRRHQQEKTPVCTSCRQANTDADNRLRRTGTTKVAA